MTAFHLRFDFNHGASITIDTSDLGSVLPFLTQAGLLNQPSETVASEASDLEAVVPDPVDVGYRSDTQKMADAIASAGRPVTAAEVMVITGRMTPLEKRRAYSALSRATKSGLIFRQADGAYLSARS